ncbi:uncharacterized protein EV154DRAFT_577909 [Mucor mucedo]|uniref:uncharacterized protein n=1 Tax=Mucor mucedo TaxID=29922 RepID=UPI002220E136|nr:uncharacterized protein EV154DRAFT_577909 [Mucor mucedo]KAI7875059.1 hypothetical protein EV154DRAFT_577909 [Mucor mucedo]
MSNNKQLVSHSNNKSCYRLYAGHGNWINLDLKTTQDLLDIFQKGIPCRYQLSAGLFIDIIPHDVDCNSKNIDMFGLMRADLVYESQVVETHVQQLMSHYIRSLLDDQGIIDAFPPLRSGEDLPIITSLPTHRHLSLVPSVVGAVRRGPKPSLYKSTDSSSALLSSSSSCSTSPRLTTKKKAFHTISNRRKRKTMPVELSMPTAATKRQAMTSSMHAFDDQNYMESSSPDYPHHHHHHHHHQQQQGGSSSGPSGGGGGGGGGSGNNTYPLIAYPGQANWNYQQQRTNFNFEFDFDQERHSPTDILNEYEYNQRFDTRSNELYQPILEEKPSSGTSTESYAPSSPHWEGKEWDYEKKPSVTTIDHRILLSNNNNLILTHSSP